jgi:hypothetical protein
MFARRCALESGHAIQGQPKLCRKIPKEVSNLKTAKEIVSLLQIISNILQLSNPLDKLGHLQPLHRQFEWLVDPCHDP